MRYAEPFRCPEAKWSLYHLKNPVRDVPLFYGGPFNGWKKDCYKEKDSLSFKELAELPKTQKYRSSDEFLKNFPESTTVTGMITDGKIFIIEGIHRCLALALANKRGLKVETKVFITLAQSPGGKLPVVGHFQKGA